jgi:DNA-binding GntR family transcriptional regulator
MKPSDLSAQDRAYDYVKGRITQFVFKPNERLRAQDIAESLGLSRTPVREALGRLEQEGLVRKEGGWGYAVRSMTYEEVMNLYRVREVLEVEAAMEALPRLNRDALVKLAQILNDARKVLGRDDPWEFLGANRRFHNAIAELSGNSILLSMLRTISERIQIVGAVVVRHHPEREEEILKENQEILDALAKGDPTAVEATVRNHVRGARASLLMFLGESPNRLLVNIGG